MPGYRLGKQWFVPVLELHRQLEGAPQESPETTVAAVIQELTADVPAMLGVEDLEDFFGVRRPELCEMLRLPVLRVSNGAQPVLTRRVLEAELLRARNGCVPR